MVSPVELARDGGFGIEPDRPAALSGARFSSWQSLAFCVLLACAAWADAADAVQWQRWEQSLSSSVIYTNPYREVTVAVTYSGPGGATLQTFGFWDGGNTFKIRCAFPTSGVWSWQTTCSDITNSGLHHQSGSVTVDTYSGDVPLYRHGLLRVSANRRYLTFSDGTPFLWMGDTAWVAPLGASQSDWQKYITDRKEKHFTVVQISPASRWSGVTTDTEGNEAFFGDGLTQWNPAYWQGFERKVQYANEQGLTVLLVGIMEPETRYPSEADARLFARNIAARLFGNFVSFSPSFDSPYQALGDQVGGELDDATPAHLLTQHVGTSLSAAQSYYDKPYLDFSGCQSGHNNGNRNTCAANAINWNLALYSRTPCKPVINLEAFYDVNGTTSGLVPKETGTAKDARSLGYLSWLSGALGYTYGAYGIWNWQTDPAKGYYWSNAIAYPSSTQMRYLHDFFAGIEWWRLEPAHSLLANQASESTNKMVLAKSAQGDLAVAYLPNNAEVRINMSGFPGVMRARWYNPTNGAFDSFSQLVPNVGTQSLATPGPGDWILLLNAAQPRLLVLTDIGGDPDDQQSMRRLMLYANEFDLVGLIASASGTPSDGLPPRTQPELIHEIINDYEAVYGNLALHAEGYPLPDALRSVIKSGNPNRGVTNVAIGNSTEGSGHIIASVDGSTEPLHVVIWGGATDLAQALFDMRAGRSESDAAAFLAKLRVYAIADQDKVPGQQGTGEWIRQNFPELRYVEAGPPTQSVFASLFRGMYQNDSAGGGAPTVQLVEDINVPLNQSAWVTGNVRTGHGPLGGNYPIVTQNPGTTRNTSGVKEGDTPSWFFVLPNGLSDPEQPTWGGWGGRFVHDSGGHFVDAEDEHWSGTSDAATRRKWTVARWRAWYQEDFAARMDWCAQPYSNANHRPIAFANNYGSRTILSTRVAPGSPVHLDARGSFDPDGHGLSYHWFFYPEAGRASSGIVISNANTALASFVAPTNSSPQPLHCILAVTDDGSPPLTSFRRVLVTVSDSTTNGTGIGSLIAHWQLDEGTGAITTDATTNHVTGTLLNGPAWTNGKSGKALEFDGLNDRVDLGNPTHLRLTGAMTLAAWVWIDSFAGNGRIVNKQGTSGSRGWSLNIESGGYGAFQVARDASTLVIVNTGPLPLRQWVHLAGTYEPGVALRCYVDGLPGPANTVAVPAAQYDSGLNAAIGDRPGGGTPFKGRIDDVRIYNGVLSKDEVSALGPLRFSSAKCLDNKVVLHWTGSGKLEWAGAITGPWTLVMPTPAPPYSGDIVPGENRFFRINATQ